MILGRTASNAIKIKTDGGLRAVNCACCGGCGCDTPMGELKDVMRNVTSSSQLTCNGDSPSFFDNGAEYILALFDLIIGDEPVSTEIFIRKATDCFYIAGYSFGSSVNLGIISEACPCAVDPEFPITCSEATIIINGIAFPAVNEVTDAPVVPGPIIFVIT